MSVFMRSSVQERELENSKLVLEAGSCKEHIATLSVLSATAVNRMLKCICGDLDVGTFWRATPQKPKKNYLVSLRGVRTSPDPL